LTLAIALIALAGIVASVVVNRQMSRTLHKSDVLLSLTTHALENATLKLRTVHIYACTLQNTSTPDAQSIGRDLVRIVGADPHLDAHNGRDSVA
jgi:hypothetical protein